MKVTHMVRVKFSIGSYTDTVECDVVPMSVCHLLLGRPWQFDRDVCHNGKTNTYELHWQGKKKVIRPMSPLDIVKESRKKSEVHLEQIQRRREPTLEVPDSFSESAAAHITASLAAAPALARTIPPNLGDADGLATAMTAMTAVPPILGDADGPFAGTAMTAIPPTLGDGDVMRVLPWGWHDLHG